MQCRAISIPVYFGREAITPGGKKDSLASWFKPEQNVNPV
jgi:hypothetical protein